jgi:electron-transferring-flavoprotein dehydrogenase
VCVEYAGLLGRVCPAAVYEYADAEGSEVDADGKKFVINSQNCIHVSGSGDLSMRGVRNLS